MEATIHLKNGTDLVRIEISEDDGSKVEKTITVSNFREIFKEKERKKYYCLNPMFDEYGPAEVVKGLICGTQGENFVNGLFFVPADKRYMNVAGEKTMIPYPSLLFLLQARNGCLTKSQCFAVKEPTIHELNLQSKLYAFPFGNVLASDAHICWGSNQLTGLDELDNMRIAITTFFCSESNMDYVRAGSSYASKYGTYAAFMRELGTRQTFPKGALVPSPCNSVVKELVESI